MTALHRLATALVLALALGTQLRAAPQEVKVGVYLKNVESIDIADNTYYLDFQLWMRWKGAIDPTQSFRFTNLIDVWGLTLTPDQEAPKTLKDGSRYQRFRVEGKFYHKFWVGTFPLDWQKITLEIEDKVHPRTALVYVPDPQAKVSPDLAIPGWDIVEVYNREKPVEHGTGFGLDGAPQPHSEYRFGLRVYRPPTFFFLKVVPPILLVILSCFLIFFLRVEYVDARFSTVIGSLLTEVFLQLSLTDALPNVGLMTLLDQIFNLSYLVMFLILVECIIVTRMMDRMNDIDEDLEDLEGDERDAAKARKEEIGIQIETIEGRARWLFPVAYVAAVVSVAVAMRGTELFSVLFQG